MLETTARRAISVQTAQSHSISFLAACWVWVRVAIYSFGGPAGQMAVMHHILVEEKRWVSENLFRYKVSMPVTLAGATGAGLIYYLLFVNS